MIVDAHADSVRPLLLVGSVPLDSTAAVMAEAAQRLGARLTRYPDGETGARKNWIAWQRAAFEAVAALVPTAAKERDYQLFPPFTLREGCTIDAVRFGALGFAREALASWKTFSTLKREGTLAPGARFQVALPTAWAPVYSFVSYRWQLEVHAIYERALLDELAQIAAAIPHDQLAVQWDIATEMSWWERVYPAPFADIEAGVIDSVARLADAVPAGAELGIHLCYGSMNNRHWKEPADTANLVAVANGLTERIRRHIDFLHLPVPRNRDDAAYFAPLASLCLAPSTELFLGLLHLEDGIEGAARRIAAGRLFAPRFGLACECGLGRCAPESITALLDLHATAAVAEPRAEAAA